MNRVAKDMGHPGARLLSGALSEDMCMVQLVGSHFDRRRLCLFTVAIGL